MGRLVVAALVLEDLCATSGSSTGDARDLLAICSRSCCSRSHVLCTKSHALKKVPEQTPFCGGRLSSPRVGVSRWVTHSRPRPSVKRSPDRLTRASEGRRVGRSGRTRASRGDTRILSLQAAQRIPWRARGMGGPASRGTLLVAPRPPAFSPQAPPVDKQEVSPRPRVRTRPGKVHVEGTSARNWEEVPHQRLFFLGLARPHRVPVKKVRDHI